jgi:hypothetical protein
MPPSTQPQSRKIDVVLLFDVEDVFSPPEVGNDDSIKELADILTEEGVIGTFLFIGDRALHLRERGRSDVIAAMTRHEVGLHTRSARHPCAPEYVAGRSWDNGVAETLRRERDGIAIIQEVFGQPACALSAHNVFTSPQAHRVAALLGLPYIYAYPAAPPLFSLSWYAGALCLPSWNPERGGRQTPAYAPEFDDAYPDTPSFDARLVQLERQVEELITASQPFMTMFLYHPQRLHLIEFIDHFWAPNGVNIPPERWGQQGQPRRYTAEQTATACANFRRLVRWIRDDGRLNPITVRELVARYGHQPVCITSDEVLAAAREVARARAPQLHARFSPAELLLGMIEAVLMFERNGAFPPQVPRHEVLGPIENPIIEPELRRCTWSHLVALAEKTRSQVHNTGGLPANLGPMFERIGINHLYVALAESIPLLASGQLVDEITFRRTPRCPPHAEEIGRRFLEICEGELVDPGLNTDALYRYGKLQTWTLKPAISIDPTCGGFTVQRLSV